MEVKVKKALLPILVLSSFALKPRRIEIATGGTTPTGANSNQTRIGATKAA